MRCKKLSNKNLNLIKEIVFKSINHFFYFYLALTSISDLKLQQPIEDWKREMNASKHEKITEFVKKSQFSNFKEKNRCPLSSLIFRTIYDGRFFDNMNSS